MSNATPAKNLIAGSPCAGDLSREKHDAELANFGDILAEFRGSSSEFLATAIEQAEQIEVF